MWIAAGEVVVAEAVGGLGDQGNILNRRVHLPVPVGARM
jgi:hypothetical protein